MIYIVTVIMDEFRKVGQDLIGTGRKSSPSETQYPELPAGRSNGAEVVEREREREKKRKRKREEKRDRGLSM